MRKRWLRVMSYLLFFAVLCSAFVLPELLLARQQEAYERRIYQESAAEKKLDVEAEDLYLVQVVHEIYRLDARVKVEYETAIQRVIFTTGEDDRVITDGRVRDVEEELARLADAGVLESFQSAAGETDFHMVITDKIFQCGEKEFLIKSIDYQVGCENLEIEREEKSGKILGVMLYPWTVEGRDKRELLENYIRYLDLDLLGDWTLDGNWMISEKADLAVGFAGRGREILGSNMEQMGDQPVYLTVQPVQIAREVGRQVMIFEQTPGSVEVYFWGEEEGD